MNSTSQRYPTADLRVSDAERDAALAELSEHFQAGRLTSDELDERVSRALTARTGRELAELTFDLPSLPGPPAEPVATRGRAWPGGALQYAIALAVIGVVAASLVIPANVRGGVFPWWLIPAGLLVCRRIARSSRRSARPAQLRSARKAGASAARPLRPRHWPSAESGKLSGPRRRLRSSGPAAAQNGGTDAAVAIAARRVRQLPPAGQRRLL